MYMLGSYLKTANNNASIAQDMLTPDGRPKGALLMSVIACYRAFKYYKSGVFLVDSDDGRGDFSEGNWGLTTAMGAWVQEIYQEMMDLDDGDWTSLLTLAITTYDSNYKRNPSQEQSAHLAAASEAAAVQASLTPTPAPQARAFHSDAHYIEHCPSTYYYDTVMLSSPLSWISGGAFKALELSQAPPGGSLRGAFKALKPLDVLVPQYANYPRNNDLQNSGASNILDQGIGFNRSGYPVDKAHTPHEVWDRREEMFLPPKQEIAAAVAATQLQRSWENRVANQRLRNNDLRKSGVSNIPDQGIGFNRSGYPVDKAHTPREVWERREDMYPPQYTGRVGYLPTNQRNPQYNCGFQAGSVNRTRNYPHVSEDRKLQGGRSPPGGNGPPGDNGDVDGDGRDDKSRKGKKPARRHRMPWDDSSEGESPPPPPPSSPPSSSKDSSSSDDDWIGAFAPNVKFLDKKVRRNLRRKTIKKLQARTDDNERRESWLKGILREYRKQIWHFCNRETVQSTEMPKGIKIPNPSRFTGSNNVEEFDTWLLALLRWIVISQLVGKVNDDQRVQVVGSFLDEDALRWYNDEATGLHCSQLNWTFEKRLRSSRLRSMILKKGVQAYKAELQRWGSRMTRPPNSYALRKKFLDGLPTSIISEMIERGASPDLATLSKMVKTVERLEDNKALEIFYLKSKTSVEEPDDFRI
ncbi:hypothetical protein BT96DRAFT_944529 [Gymnopus androsaceus JB14]|uniref:Uncharacterized protein n=1 Tax=Gymnopus androsaceus JB14 TaxID=1447944 RepID=A0A6A4H487_9AGAR|nr:hypothetical protein BT96DRAFT_944529 [Gymnopus androsaceus JB14]